MVLPNLVATLPPPPPGFRVTGSFAQILTLSRSLPLRTPFTSNCTRRPRTPVRYNGAKIALSRFCCGVALGIRARARLAWFMLGAGRGGAARASASLRRDRLK